MADEKAIERAASIDNPNLSKCSLPSQSDPNAQGESLFLPYLVEHLRSSLQQQPQQQQPTPPARRRRQTSAPSMHHLECGRVEDSGTESGEDLRFLAAGLRDSIELHRRAVPQEQDPNEGILSEVQSALSRLQESLQQGCLGSEQVDSSKQDSLLQLIDRLQTSLQLPAAGSSWQKQSKPTDLPRGSSQRFAGRKSNRRTRHTVGVTREELADVRRFLEETEMRNKLTVTSGQDKPPDVPPRPAIGSPYELVKQCSAGDVPTIGSQGPSAFKRYRPTHFLNKKPDEPGPFSECAENRKSDLKLNSAETKKMYKNENTGSEDEGDDDMDFVEETAVKSKAFVNNNNRNTESLIGRNADFKQLAPTQCVQNPVYKAPSAEQRHQDNVIEPETSDEDTVTDASYESETEKAESDGYEEEDREFEEEEENQRLRSNRNPLENTAGIVRNLTYTIQPQVQTSAQKQKHPNYKGQSSSSYKDHRHEHRHQYVHDKKQAQREPDGRSQEKLKVSNQHMPQSVEDRSLAQHKHQRNPPSYVHHDASPKYVETPKKNHSAVQVQWNGSVNKNAVKEPSRNQKQLCINDNPKIQQDKNNNREAAEFAGDKNGTSAQKDSALNATDSPKAARFANRQLKKQKMKRANTIDIPKPLHYYDVEEESGHSSEGELQSGRTNSNQTKENRKVDHTSHKFQVNHSENVRHNVDVRGSNLQKLEKVKNMFEHGPDGDSPSYNPQAHGGAQWNSRFANIKTCFENPPPKGSQSSKKQQTESSNRARSFWRSADDSSLKVSKNSAFHDPKLSKQGSEFLKKLHEQKDQGQAQKLPWTATEHENIVVGSLVVPANLNKNVQPSQPQGPVNKFSHAPMSAFRPIEKKNPAPAGNAPWAAPSVTGSVKQIATSKFSLPDAQPPAPVFKQEPPKQTVKASVHLQTPPGVTTSVSPTLPWTKDVSHGHVLNSALAKFESMSSRESSPQLMPNALLRSQSQDRVALPSNFTVFSKTVPAPPPRTYIPVPPTNIVQARTQTLIAPQRPDQALPFIQEHPNPLVHSKSNQYLPQANYYSGLVKNHPLLEGDHSSDSDNDEPAPSSSRLVLSTLQGVIDPPVHENRNALPVQTYSAGVTARQSIYGVVMPPIVTSPAPLPEEQNVPVPRNNQSNADPIRFHDPQPPHPDFAEEHTAAVTRVMGQQQCQSAVTVSHKTRHYNEGDDGERGTAAFHLSSLLNKFSGDDEPPVTKPQKAAEVPVPPKPKQVDPPLESKTSMPIPQTAALPPKPEGSPRLARAADAGYRPTDQRGHSLQVYEPERSARGVPRHPHSPSPNDDYPPECVYASRFEIPVNKVQNITMKFQSPVKEHPTEVEERKPPVSPNPGVVLRKSESWHQLAAQQQGLARRPQSMVVTDLPPVKPRSPHALHKAKSSHSLAFPKQFEAAIKPEALEKKQKTVEEFFRKGKTEIKTSPKTSVQKQTKIAHHARSYSAESAGVFLLDDNMDNVDEAFESLFNATSSDGKTKVSKSSKASTTRIANR